MLIGPGKAQNVYLFPAFPTNPIIDRHAHLGLLRGAPAVAGV
jgi:hypothetical protein